MRLRESRKTRRRRRAVKIEHARKQMRHLKIDSEEALLCYCQDKGQEAHDRLRACGAVADLLGRAAIPFLLRLAADEEAVGVDAALHGLRSIGTRRATRLLMRTLRGSKDDARRQAALDALRFLEDRRSERLVAHVLLTDGCAQTRELAAEVMAYVHRGRRSVRALMQALRDPSPSVRWWVLAAVSGIPDVYESDLDMIREYLSDEAIAPGSESPEEATVAAAARHALEAQVPWRRKQRRPFKRSQQAGQRRDGVRL